MKEILALLNQYADDMGVFTQANAQSIGLLFERLDSFERQTGLSINYDKTTVYRFGSIKHSNAKFYSDRQLNWTNEPIKVLGIWIDHNEDECAKINYEKLINKSRAILAQWSKRSLSLIGKIEIVNSLIESLFVYKMYVLPTIPLGIVKQMENMVNTFLWKGRPKISMEILQASKESGGMRLMNLNKKDKAVKLSWINLLKNDSDLAKIVYSYLQPNLKEDIWRCNLSENDVKYLNIKSNFWKSVLQAWCEFNYENVTENPQHQILWYNSHIRVNGELFG